MFRKLICFLFFSLDLLLLVWGTVPSFASDFLWSQVGKVGSDSGRDLSFSSIEKFLTAFGSHNSKTVKLKRSDQLQKPSGGFCDAKNGVPHNPFFDKESRFYFLTLFYLYGVAPRSSTIKVAWLE